ncbi:MAG: hypothetical protein R3E96_11315 [Planctomycetota bacterium]
MFLAILAAALSHPFCDLWTELRHTGELAVLRSPAQPSISSL